LFMYKIANVGNVPKEERPHGADEGDQAYKTRVADRETASPDEAGGEKNWPQHEQANYRK